MYNLRTSSGFEGEGHSRGRAKLAQILRQHGLRAGLKAVWKYLRANVLRCEVESYVAMRREHRTVARMPSPMAEPALRFAAVTLEQPQALQALLDAWPPEWRSSSRAALSRALEAELRAGDECYAFWEDDRIVAASWIGYGNSPYLQRFARAFGLECDEALRRTTFVAPSHRGRKLQVMLADRVEEHVARTRGVRRFIVYVGARNAASLSNLTQVYDEVRPVRHVRLTILGKAIDWFPARSRSEWRRLTHDARAGSRGERMRDETATLP